MSAFDWLPPVPFLHPGPKGSRDYLTLVHTTNSCGKQVKLDADGKAVWESHGDVIEGVALTVHVPDAEAMATLLRLLPASHYVVPDFIAEAGLAPFEIMAQKRLNNALSKPEGPRPIGLHNLPGHNLPVWAKLKENFTPGSWRLFDFDRDEHTPKELRKLPKHEALARLEEAIPGLKGCARVAALSSKGRVLKDGKPLASSPNFHMWVQVADPDLTDEFRQRLLPRLADAGLGWKKPRGDKTGPAALVDPSVWAISRCVYAGAPAVGEGLTLAPAEVLATVGHRYTLASLPPTSEAEHAAAKRVFGIEWHGNGSSGSFRDTSGQLTEDTILEVKGHKPMTLAEFMANDAFKPGEKYRCQTPFRASTSWNAILRKYNSGAASVFDNGTGVSYWWPDPLDGLEEMGTGSAGNSATVPELSECPTFRVFDDWLEHGGTEYRPGVWHFGLDRKGEHMTPTWVCTPLHIDAVTFDGQDNNYGRLLRFKNANGRWREWAMPMELLAGSGDGLRAELLAMGMGIAPSTNARNLLATYLQSHQPKRRMHCAQQVGWANGSFVLPDMVIGAKAAGLIFQSGERGHDEYTQGGTLVGWQEGIAKKAVGNPLLGLAISASFAGPLLHLCKAESGGIHYQGDSSIGKTTLIEAACATWGGPSYKRSWRATSNGMEGAAAMFNDGLLALDEISECDPREVGAIVYALANGVGKQRAGRTGSARAVTRWRVCVLSSGERTIAATMEEAGRRQKAGQSVRLLDIPVARPLGAWDNLHGADSSAVFSDSIKQTAATHYGHAGREFLDKLTRDSRDFCAMRESYKSMPEFKADDAEGQDKRAAARFALLAMAGELATEYGITGWPKGEAIKAAAEGLRLWREARGRGNTERRQILEQVTDFLNKYGGSRFSCITDSDSRVMDRAGWWRGGPSDVVELDWGGTPKKPEGRAYLFTPVGLREALKGFDFKGALKVLQEAGVLPEPGAGGKSSITEKIDGRSVRVYAIQWDALFHALSD